MSLLQFLRILAARKAIVLAILLSCLASAVVVSQLLPERYQARSRIILDLVKPDPVTGELLSTQFLTAYVRTQIELIQDERTTGRVVDALGWASNPTIVAQYSDSDDGAVTDVRRVLAQRISDSTEVQILDRSNIMEITFTWSSPEAARQIADLIRETYIDLSLESRRETASRTADWYRDQADKALRLLSTAEKSRSDFAQANGIVLAAGDTDLESAKLSALSTQSAIPIMGAQALPPPSTVQLDQINQQIAQAASTLGPNHPVFQALQRQRAVIETEAARQRNAANSLSSPGASMAQIEQAYQMQKSRVVAQRDKIDRLNQMKNDIEIRRDQYLKAAQRAADLRREADVGETGMSPLGSATADSAPSYPNVPLIIAGAIGLGGALGICLALLVEMVGRRVRSDDDLAHAAGAPVFAIVGDSRNPDGWVRRTLRMLSRKAATRQSKALGEADDMTALDEIADTEHEDAPSGTDLVGSSAADLVDADALSSLVVLQASGVEAESIRALRTRIMAQHVAEGRRSLAICSPAADSGCTFVAANLAAAVAQIGVKTVLVDADLREPRATDLFGLPQDGLGLSDYLAHSGVRLQSIVQSEVLPHLSVISAGTPPSNPQELLASSRFRSLIDQLLREYDLTILDTTPANTCTDAQRVATVAGYSLIVARKHKTYVGDVATLAKLLRADRSVVVGTVLTDF